MRCMLLPNRPVPHSARIMAFLVLSAELQRALQSQRTPISQCHSALMNALG